MHHSTLLTLMLLMFGQVLILAFGAFVLWLAGEFEDAPKPFNTGHPADEAGETTIAMGQRSGKQSNENSDGLVGLAHDHSIAPQATKDRINQLTDHLEHSRDRAVGVEK